MSRVLGVDLGARRIGLAVSDRSRTLATPLTVLERRGDPRADHVAILEAARAEDATSIVVGMPRSLSGDSGPAARAAADEITELRALAGDAITVEQHDERFTTVTAQRRLREGGTHKRTTPIDAAAAAEILQSYLDRIPRPDRNGRERTR
jgi:putative Holliday junction resolvase